MERDALLIDVSREHEASDFVHLDSIACAGDVKARDRGFFIFRHRQSSEIKEQQESSSRKLAPRQVPTQALTHKII